MTIDAVELRRIELPLVSPFQTSFGTWTFRDILLVRVLATGPDGAVEGWGECTAGTQPLYSSEYTEGCECVTRDHLLPRLFHAGVRHGADVATALAEVQGHRMAKAAVEAAVLDAELRAAGVSLADHLGATVDRVPVGVSIGILPTLDDLVRTAGDHLAEGYARIKIKIKPGWDLEPCRALRAVHGDDFGLQVDANAAYRPDDIAPLAALDEFGLLLIEQPFPEEMLVDNVDLVAAIDTPVCLDESIVNEAVAVDAIRLGATSVINIKPGRVGGHLAGKAIHDHCVAAGVPVWHGGMLETGIGRAPNLALAALPGFTLPGDISAADRYWHRDIVTRPAVLESDGTVRVPSGPGIGVDVDLDFLTSVTTTVALHESGA
ncbi:o-succinylbenzoate synthase [Actinospongicola halichondriae]|uniref:o-succinylbenzoate synthase n=1 Tax=Actinospongicola halichondriae TaxID=3236844 RepID=UPI003D517D52